MFKLQSLLLTCCVSLAVPSGFGASIGGFSETTLGTSATDPDLIKCMGYHLECDLPFLGFQQRNWHVDALQHGRS